MRPIDKVSSRSAEMMHSDDISPFAPQYVVPHTRISLLGERQSGRKGKC